jgi:hypothetical protein
MFVIFYYMELVSYTVKKVSDFPVPSRDVTNQTLLPGIIKITNLFLQCRSSCWAPHPVMQVIANR